MYKKIDTKMRSKLRCINSNEFLMVLRKQIYSIPAITFDHHSKMFPVKHINFTNKNLIALVKTGLSETITKKNLKKDMKHKIGT